MKKFPNTSAGGARVRIAEVVPAQAKVDGQLPGDLPCVFDESAVRHTGRVPTVLCLFASGWVVSKAGSRKHIVAGQIEQAVEVEGRLIIGTVEDLYVVGEESFISDFDVVRSGRCGSHVPPVVVMLDEVSLGEA